MRKRRVFIAIRPSPELRERFFELSRKWPDMPCRWVKPDNVHLTLIPPMHLDENEIALLIHALRAAGKTTEQFSIEIERVTYGPPGQSGRMIWALGRESRELAAFKTKLEDAILNTKIPFRVESRPFRYPHLTLARMFEKEWRNYEPKPHINELLKTELPVETIEIMESELQPGGAGYTVLAIAPLKND